MHPTIQDSPAEVAFANWRSLRVETRDHNTLCPCADCSERRRLAADLNIPHVGPARPKRLQLASMSA